MNIQDEVTYEKRELHRHYRQTRNALWKAIDQLQKLEDEYGFEYSETANTLRELAKQLRADEAMATEFIETMEWDFRADDEAVAS